MERTHKHNFREYIQEIIRLRKEGLSVVRIGKVMDKDHTTIVHHLQKWFKGKLPPVIRVKKTKKAQYRGARGSFSTGPTYKDYLKQAGYKSKLIHGVGGLYAVKDCSVLPRRQVRNLHTDRNPT